MTRLVSALFALFTLLSLSAAAEPKIPPGMCHVGTYAMADGSHLVIAPSDAPNLRYRTLSGVSGRLYLTAAAQYESGDGWSVREPVALRVSFGNCEDRIIRWRREGAREVTGRKLALPTIPISFTSGTASLYGELVMPLERRPRTAVVLQFGSGHDSAVLHNFVQYLLPMRDIAVFVFDKRGTGRSTGGFSAHIGELADDMVAAAQAVRARPELEAVPVGLMGESQGGWVAPLAAHKMAATKTPADFVVVGYGLAVSMLEEDRQEVAQSLREGGYGADVLAKGEQLHRAAATVMVSRFARGLDELERLKTAYRNEPWFGALGGDFTGPLTSTTAERIPELQAEFNFPYDLAYDPLPVIGKLTMPQLWVLAGRDTEAPHETTLANLRPLQARGLPLEVVVFPDAEHGMIAVKAGAEVDKLAGHHADGHELAGHYAKGYFDLLFDWIGRQRRAPATAE